MEQTVNHYLKTRVMSASPQELRLLLLDGSIKFARQAAEGLRKKDFELSYNGFTQARAIVMELINGISNDMDPELAGKIRSLYLFMYRELMDASFAKSPEKVDKIVELLQYERETWVLAMEKAADEKRAGVPGRSAGGPPKNPSPNSGPARAASIPQPRPADPDQRGPLSIQA